MLFRRPRVAWDTAYIEVMDNEEAVRIVSNRHEGMSAVLFAFTGCCGYDGLSGAVWESLDDRSEAKAEIAKGWLWHMLHEGICALEDIRENA